MADVVNLNRFRKAKARDVAKVEADANRRLHGRTKAEKQLEKLEKARADKLLDGARIDRD